MEIMQLSLLIKSYAKEKAPCIKFLINGLFFPKDLHLFFLRFLLLFFFFEKCTLCVPSLRFKVIYDHPIKILKLCWNQSKSVWLCVNLFEAFPKIIHPHQIWIFYCRTSVLSVGPIVLLFWIFSLDFNPGWILSLACFITCIHVL